MRKQSKKNLGLGKVTLADLNERLFVTLNVMDLGKVKGGGETDTCGIDTSPATSFGTNIRVFC